MLSLDKEGKGRKKNAVLLLQLNPVIPQPQRVASLFSVFNICWTNFREQQNLESSTVLHVKEIERTAAILGLFCYWVFFVWTNRLQSFKHSFIKVDVWIAKICLDISLAYHKGNYEVRL